MTNVFIFGSNLKAAHGKGAALEAATNWGAINGEIRYFYKKPGPLGCSYAIPTKDYYLKVLPLDVIKQHVDVFIDFAAEKVQYNFLVTAVGCGLAGYRPEQIAPLFNAVGQYKHIFFPEEFGMYMNVDGRPISFDKQGRINKMFKEEPIKGMFR